MKMARVITILSFISLIGFGLSGNSLAVEDGSTNCPAIAGGVASPPPAAPTTGGPGGSPPTSNK